MSANLSNQVTRRLTSPGFDRALAGRSGPVFSRPAALRPATRQASGVGNLGTKQRSLTNTQRNRKSCVIAGGSFTETFITAKLTALQHAAVQQYKDQLQPYQAFGCDPLQVGAHGLAEPWQGTLFRFPLRNADLAACSRISKQVYDVPKAQQLLLGLRSEATLMLLFLKSVHTLEVWDWAPGALAPIVQFSCAVGNASVQLHHERALFTRASAAAMAAAAAAAVQAGGGGGGGGFGTARSPDGCESSFELLLTSTHHVPDAAGANVATRTRTFLVCQGAAGGATASLAMQLSSNLASPLVPWGAVAADITPPGTPDGSNGDADGCGGHREGRAFCFLPLPARTGLPLHVNGFFELSSNRRDVWHGADLAGSGAQRAKWNEALLENAIAPAYARLLALAAARLGPGEAYARLWPTADAPAPWQRVVTELFRLVADMPVAWTDALGGKWLAPSQARWRGRQQLGGGWRWCLCR
eukprot:355618-Chlamydomonas_euryale.AAC.1